jgi:hypothetical protein
MPTRVGKGLRGRSANVPLAAFRNHDQQMKNWKGPSSPPLAHSHRPGARSRVIGASQRLRSSQRMLVLTGGAAKRSPQHMVGRRGRAYGRSIRVSSTASGFVMLL